MFGGGFIGEDSDDGEASLKFPADVFLLADLSPTTDSLLRFLEILSLGSLRRIEGLVIKAITGRKYSLL